ncbi:MAG: DUF1905 domain-containing protein [Bacteroidota bacterium]
MKFTFTQSIGQLEARKGGYFYLKIMSETVDQFEKKRATRLICDIDDKLQYSCGLNHYGDGNFYLILSGKNLKKLGKSLGDEVTFSIYEDPNPLGVAIPEVLQVLIDQDEKVKADFDQLTDGKKRSLIYTIVKIKDIDLQVSKIMSFLEEERLKALRKSRAKTK